MKPKEWLFRNGHMTREDADKRGRLSAANKALVMEAVANGAVIEGYDVVKEKDSPTGAPVKVERVAIDPNRIADVPDMTRDERSLAAYRRDEAGKQIEIGMRTVCNVCGSSLTYCGCESPRVWVDHERQAVVHFATRTRR